MTPNTEKVAEPKTAIDIPPLMRIIEKNIFMLKTSIPTRIPLIIIIILEEKMNELF
jgi:hypothetical protein